MNETQFEEQYPEIANLLGNGFWSKVDPHHPISFSVVMDNESGLDHISNLINKTPSSQIATSYENDLYSRRGFDSFMSEMVGYIASEQWLCSNPQVLDVKGANNKPEFECDDVDVEVARIRESHEIDRVRVHLMEELGGGCLASISKKPAYDNYASDGSTWEQNEKQVRKLINKIGSVSKDDLPLSVETQALKLELRESEADGVAFVGGSSVTRIVPDANDQITRAIKQKADKCRDNRPIVVFLDLDISTVDYVEEVVWMTIGEPHQFAFADDVEVSDDVEEVDSKWDDYLEEIGAKGGLSAIPPGDEGVFASGDVSCIAGVMVRLVTNEVAYVPNVYTDDVNAKEVFDRLDWGTETRSLTADII